MADGTLLLRRHALGFEDALLAGLESVARTAPFRHMQTPGGFTMSVAMTNCGSLGWTTSRTGYRYTALDPQTGEPWPAMPGPFSVLAAEAAREADYAGFQPDACLINRYEPGAKMSLHQDKDEDDFSQPIVSVSLGLPAVFLWGGLQRSDPTRKVLLRHGDVLVWGGPSRLVYHGIAALKQGQHSRLGAYRINLTFRRAG